MGFASLDSIENTPIFKTTWKQEEIMLIYDFKTNFWHRVFSKTMVHLQKKLWVVVQVS